MTGTNLRGASMKDDETRSSDPDLSKPEPASLSEVNEQDESTQESAPELEAMLKQLELVDIRMRHHITRFWALPSAYLGVVFLVFSGLEKSDLDAHQPFLSGGLVLFGCLVLVAMAASNEGFGRSVRRVGEIEAALHLKVSPRMMLLQFLPYYLVALVGIGYSIAMLVT